MAKGTSSFHWKVFTQQRANENIIFNIETIKNHEGSKNGKRKTGNEGNGKKVGKGTSSFHWKVLTQQRANENISYVILKQLEIMRKGVKTGNEKWGTRDKSWKGHFVVSLESAHTTKRQ